jgi:hypothetical protein
MNFLINIDRLASTYNVEKQNFFVKINFPEQGRGVFFSSIKNSLRAKFKSLKRILSSWVRTLLNYVLLMVQMSENVLNFKSFK